MKERIPRPTSFGGALAAVAAIAAVAALAAGCGGSPKAANTGSTSASSASATSSNDSSSSGGNQLVKFAQCMRAQGLADFPDPVNGQLNLRVTKGGDLDPNSPGFQAALQSCQSLLPAGKGPGTAPSPTRQTQFLKFARCMRSHGVSDFPDPQAGGFLMSGNVQQNPHFQSAMQACRSILGNGPLVGAGG